MNIPPFGRNCDGVDAAGAAILVCAVCFAAIFFWQAAAGAARQEESYREALHRKVGKAIMKERSRIEHLLPLEEGSDGPLWERALAEAPTYRGNSQLHLLLGRGFVERGLLAEGLAHYRRAVEGNREYADRRSPWYRGEELEPLVQRGKREFLAGGGSPGSDAARTAVRDLFFIERSLAGGCH